MWLVLEMKVLIMLWRIFELMVVMRLLDNAVHIYQAWSIIFQRVGHIGTKKSTLDSEWGDLYLDRTLLFTFYIILDEFLLSKPQFPYV